MDKEFQRPTCKKSQVVVRCCKEVSRNRLVCSEWSGVWWKMAKPSGHLQRQQGQEGNQQPQGSDVGGRGIRIKGQHSAYISTAPQLSLLLCQLSFSLGNGQLLRHSWLSSSSRLSLLLISLWTFSNNCLMSRGLNWNWKDRQLSWKRPRWWQGFCFRIRRGTG